MSHTLYRRPGPPQGRQMLVKVMVPDSDYWPLPRYLRNLKQIGWWDQMPTDPFAPVMIVAAKRDASLDEKKTHVMVGYFQLRAREALAGVLLFDIS